MNLLQSEHYGRRQYAGMDDVLEEHAHAFRDRLEDGYEELPPAAAAVSGPAADRFVAAVTDYGALFRGSVLTRHDAKRLLKDPNLQVYNNADQFLACCYDRLPGAVPPRRRPAGAASTGALICSDATRMRQYRAHRRPHVQPRRRGVRPGCRDLIAGDAVPDPGPAVAARERLLGIKADHERRRLTVAPEVLEAPETL